MSARLELAEAYTLAMRAQKRLEAALDILCDDARREYGDREPRDLDTARTKVNALVDDLRWLIAERD